MRYRDFVPYSILGCGLWVSAHILIGYVFSRSIDTATKYAGKGAFLLGALIVVVVGAVVLVRHLRVAENRRAAVRWMERHAATRWLIVARPPLPAPAALPLGPRHARRHLRAGVHLADGGPRRLPLRPRRLHGRGRPRTGPDARRRHRDGSRRRHPHAAGSPSCAKVVTVLGSGAVAWGLTARLRRPSAMRRRWTEFAVLLAGMALTAIGFHEIKAAVDRPRPPDPLVGFSGSSFPSGHAAYSVLYAVAGGDDRRFACDPGWRAAPRWSRRDRADRAGRPLPRLPRRPLPQRRQRRLGARRRGVLALRGGGARHLPSAPESRAVICSRAGQDRQPVPALRGRGADQPGRLRHPDPRPGAQLLRSDLGEDRRRVALALRARSPWSWSGS